MYTLVSVLPHFYFPRNTAGKPYLIFLFCICIFSCICNGISCFIFSCIFWPFNLLVSFGQVPSHFVFWRKCWNAVFSRLCLRSPSIKHNFGTTLETVKLSGMKSWYPKTLLSTHATILYCSRVWCLFSEQKYQLTPTQYTKQLIKSWLSLSIKCSEVVFALFLFKKQTKKFPKLKDNLSLWTLSFLSEWSLWAIFLNGLIECSLFEWTTQRDLRKRVLVELTKYKTELSIFCGQFPVGTSVIITWRE